jgi:hypothetical protein
LAGKKIAVLNSTTAPYPTAVAELGALRATTAMVNPGAAATAPSIIPFEFHRDLDSYFSHTAKKELHRGRGAYAFRASQPVQRTGRG